MFKELVELGKELDGRQALLSPGFYDYTEPIKWVVHLWPDRIYLEETQLRMERPYSGRTSGVQAHLLADEAAYALGVAKKKGGDLHKDCHDKHRAFRELINKFRAWPGLQDPALREALDWLDTALDGGLLPKDPRYGDILSKDWVSFVPEVGPLAGQHLYLHPDAVAFWLVELQERSNPGEEQKKLHVVGQCAVCGEVHPLVGRIPLGVKLAGNKPMHSLNEDAFTSFQAGSGTFKRAHLGVCFHCGDTAARAFNYLVASDQHRRIIARDKLRRDGLGNQVAVFWLKAPAPIEVGDRLLDVQDLTAVDWGAVLQETQRPGAPESTPSQLLELLRSPWKPAEHALALDDYAFHLGVVSPNVGRVAVREWVQVSLAELKEHLRHFLEAVRIVSSYGDPPRPLAICTLVDALQTENPNLVRGLLRTAFTGVRPPAGLIALGVATLRNPKVLQKPQEAWRLQAAAGAVKLSLFHRKEEAERMSALDTGFKSRAYLCGRLLAILEEAQLRASHFSLNRTMVDRFYGAASTTPAATFGGLLKLATTAHLPETGRELNELVQQVMASLDDAGGFPRTLSLVEQAEFGLGFYHQRAAFRAQRHKKSDEKTDGGDTQ